MLTPPVLSPYPAPTSHFLARRCLITPKPKNANARSNNAPTTANPAITPPPSELLLFPPAEVELEVSSMTNWRTHSPNVHSLKLSPLAPNNCWSTLCLKLHWAVPFVEGAWQEISRVPTRPSIVLVRFATGFAPQNEVLRIHVHAKWSQFQSSSPPPSLWGWDCVQEEA